MNDTTRFLQLLWDNPPPGQVLVWHGPPQRRSVWYFSLDDVKVEGYLDRDLYTGVGIAALDAKLGDRIRAKREEVIGIAGMWADIDVAGPAHQKPNLPPTDDTAQDILLQAPLPPTVVVHSGHGLQAWWLFEDGPWLFESDTDRDRAEQLSYSWYYYLLRIAENSGYTIDATWDLPRVLRLPGTVNNKVPNAPCPVTVLTWDGPRMSREAFFEVVPLISPPTRVQPPLREPGDAAGHILVEGLDAEAEPPFDKFHALLDNSPQFRRTWERNRPDLTDQSASGYDLSLAAQSAAVGWTDSEITALLVASRRYYGDKIKSDPAYYYGRTVARARQPQSINGTGNVEIEREIKQADLSEPQAEVYRKLGLRLSHVVKRGQSRAAYELVLADGRVVVVGRATDLLSAAKVQAAVYDATGIHTRKPKGVQWDMVVDALTMLTVELAEVPVDEATETREWLATLLLTAGHCATEDDLQVWATQPTSEATLYTGDVLYFKLPGLRLKLQTEGVNIPNRDLALRVSRLGSQPHRLHFYLEGKQYKRRVWFVSEAEL